MFYRRRFVTSSRLNLFLRESGKLYTLYMVAGAAAIPAGALYAILSVAGYGNWWSAILAIVVGLWMAEEAWRFVERTLFIRDFTLSGASATWPLCPVSGAVAVGRMPLLSRSAPTATPLTRAVQLAGTSTIVTTPVSQNAEHPVLTIQDKR